MYSQDSKLSFHLLATLAFGAAFFSSCDEGDDGASANLIFVVKTASPAVSAGTPLIVSGKQMAFLGSEINTGNGGTNWNVDNGDADKGDSIVFVGDMTTSVVRNLKVAVDLAVSSEQVIAFVNGTLFIAVSESADSRMWNADMDMTDRVLCYARPGATEATYLADLDPGANVAFLATANQLIFQTADASPGANRTNLFRTEVTTFGAEPSAPSQVGTVFTSHIGSDGLECHLAKTSGNLVTMTLNEAVEGDLNGDTDSLDPYVLCLLDGSDSAAMVVVTEMSVSSPNSALRATFQNGDYLVAFLVEEASMGDNLNDPGPLGGSTWQPTQCSGLDDIDELDLVLHWLRLADFASDPITFVKSNR